MGNAWHAPAEADRPEQCATSSERDNCASLLVLSTCPVCCIGQHTSAYVSVRQHTSRSERDNCASLLVRSTCPVCCTRQHTSAYVSIRRGARETIVRVYSFVLRVGKIQHPSACVSMCQHTSKSERGNCVSLVPSTRPVCWLCVCLCVYSVSVAIRMLADPGQTCFFGTTARMHPYASGCVHESGVSICTFVLVKQEK